MKIRALLFWCLAGAAWATVSTADAAAVLAKATTRHFNVYGRLADNDLRDVARDLERYHGLLATAMPTSREAAGPRLDIYLLDDPAELRAAEPDLDPAAAGFYRAGPGGRAAMLAWDEGDRAQARHVLQHEYAHHYMAQYFARAYPAWFSEGFAEYFGSADLKARSIDLGGVPPTRKQELERRSWIPLDRLLNASRDGDTEMLYAQGWLLTHYLLRSPEGAATLKAYLDALANGQPEAAAFASAFTIDKTTLQKRLEDYARSGMMVTIIPSGPTPSDEVAVTPMDASASALLAASLRLMRGRRGESEQQAKAFLGAVRKQAATLPDDAFAQRVLAHAEQVFGRPEAAIEILRRPVFAQDPYAQYLLGVSWAAKGRASPATAADDGMAAKTAFGRAVRLDPSFYPALYRYAGALPKGDEKAADALVQAHLLAPQVDQIRIAATIALLDQKEFDLASGLARPLAASPHPDLNAAIAQILVDCAQAHLPAPDPAALQRQAQARLGHKF